MIRPPTTSPPSFEEAKNRRQQARAAGMDPDYWYAALHSHELRPGQAREVVFWKRSLVVYRGEDGALSALEDRCAHRQLKLSLGEVKGCQIVCPYHGWRYDADGKVAAIPHDLFGKRMPTFRIASFPVKERFGLIWIFPGDASLSEVRRIPDIPQLEGPDAWSYAPLDFTWRAHHSMVIDNVSDFTHEYLHRKYRPFHRARLTRAETVGDRVDLEYDTLVGGGPIYGRLIDRTGARTDHIKLSYDYPYQRSNTGDRIFHWCFVLPIDERTTRAFFIFYLDVLRVPVPRRLMSLVHRLANRVLIGPLLAQDGFALEAEQVGYERHFEAPVAELNPAVAMFQELTIRKWREHLARASARGPVKART